MTIKADRYLEKAEQFEALAQQAQADLAKAAYEHLAWSYRQLGIYVSRDTMRELEGLPERFVGGGKRKPEALGAAGRAADRPVESSNRDADLSLEK
jgi:hypothetical protein